MLGLPDQRVVRVLPSQRRAAVACLLSTTPADPSVTRFLDAAQAEGSDLSLFWGTPAAPGSPSTPGFVDTCLIVPGTGRTAMVFISAGDLEPPDPEVAQRRGRLIHAVLGFLRLGADPVGTLSPVAQNLALAQALVLPDQRAAAAALEAGGLARLADLAYMKRDIPRRPVGGLPVWPGGVTVTPVSRLAPADAEGLLIEALNGSYVGTLDCPALCGLRSVHDVLESHRAVGEYDPRLWFLVSDQSSPAGCMLLSRVAATETVELVYLGLAARVRGRGLGRQLLELALNLLAGKAERTLACAVDTANTPALALYRALRFRTFATRVALVGAL